MTIKPHHLEVLETLAAMPEGRAVGVRQALPPENNHTSHRSMAHIPALIDLEKNSYIDVAIPNTPSRYPKIFKINPKGRQALKESKQ